MSTFICYCGEEVSATSGHLPYCEVWKKSSPIYKTVQEYLSSGVSMQMLRSELSALTESFCPDISSMIQCQVCLQFFPDMDSLFLSECCHIVCKSHLQHQIESLYSSSGSIKCLVPDCPYVLSRRECEYIVGSSRLYQLANNQSVELPGIVAECMCGTISILEPGSIDYNFRDEEGNYIRPDAAEHMAIYRFRCPTCDTVSCANCKVSPYHTGKTCEEFREHQESSHCRYCNSIVQDNQICNFPDCAEKRAQACSRVMDCGHQCYGSANETECVGCLQDECVMEGTREHDYCSICYVEGVGQAPCVRLTCGHVLHFHCVVEVLSNGFVGPRLSFGYAKCPSCKEWICAPGNETISRMMEEVMEKYEELKEKSLRRLVFERMENDERLLDANGIYYQKPDLYALDRFSYYICFACKNIYFGGKKECEQNVDRDFYKPEELICPSCSCKDTERSFCTTHGKDFIEFKCRYCCSLACWFCWGTTHFCDPCHRRVNAGEDITQIPKDRLPQCNGGEECPLKVNHPPNGDECALGCAVCRDLAAHNQDF